MTRKLDSRLLDSGDAFPSLDLDLVTGGKLTLPTGLTRPFNVVLVNRGSWCPFCIAQLKAFQSGLSKLEAEGIGVVAFSADPLDKARGVAADNQLTFPVGYGASVERTASVLGTFYDPAPSHTTPYLQSTGFVLAPGGKVLTSVYSSGAIGRLVWQDVLGLVQYIKSHSS